MSASRLLRKIFRGTYRGRRKEAKAFRRWGRTLARESMSPLLAGALLALEALGSAARAACEMMCALGERMAAMLATGITLPAETPRP